METGKTAEIRKQILLYLEKNSRVEIGELAVLLGTDEVTIANEMAAMEKEQIICGYHTLINWDKAGSEYVNALIEVKVTPQRDKGLDETAERISNYPEVEAVYLISGGYDLMVLIEGRTIQEISRFVSSKLAPIEDVVSTVTYFIMKKYKDHGTLMIEKKKSERMLVTP